MKKEYKQGEVLQLMTGQTCIFVREGTDTRFVGDVEGRGTASIPYNIIGEKLTFERMQEIYEDIILFLYEMCDIIVDKDYLTKETSLTSKEYDFIKLDRLFKTT